jgi:pyruvate dehydrogenase E2 component (dihydrolipoamide acetyltransferase)
VGDIKQFLLPDLGEGLTEGDLVRWTVKIGDRVDVNDTIAEVETVKAAVELPSPWAGTVTGLHAEEGTTVPVGTPIISIEVGGGAAQGAAAPGAGEDMVPAVPASDSEDKQMTLVGYGPREDGGRRRRRRPTAPAAEGAQVSFNVPPAAAPPPAAVQPEPVAAPPAAAAPQDARVHVLAKPPVRKLAKTLGVDLAGVHASGPGGTITREDVETAATATPSASPAAAAPTARETRIPVRGVRKHTAAAMVASAFTAPHVTEFVTVDVTAMIELRDRVAARREFRDVKVSPLVFLAKAVILAVQRTPEINASWDEAAGEIVLKHYVNLGIAAATDRGLVVPNIKDADRLSLRELAQALTALTETARAGKTSPAEMSGGTITITNVGVFGVDTGTPILNPGESGIVAFGAVRRMPWVVGSGADERLEPRWVTSLAVSFDHRIVDGQQGSQFLADVATILTDPAMALL